MTYVSAYKREEAMLAQHWASMARARKETIPMSAMLPPQPDMSLEARQMLPAQREGYSSAIPGQGIQQPKVLITGDLRLYVTESEAALQPIKGSYSIETVGMQEPLHILWYAEGQVLSRQARSTDIVFDLPGTRAGQPCIYLVAVQVTERGVQGRVVLSGTFVHIFVTSSDL